MKKYWVLGLGFILVFSLFQGVSLAAETENSQALTLEQAMEQALVEDMNLQSAKLKVENAEADLKAAKRIIGASGNLEQKNVNSQGWQSGANYITIYPGETQYNAKVSLTYTPNVFYVDDTTGMNFPSDKFELSYSPFNMSFEMGIKQRELALASQVMNYESARIKLITDVRNTYSEMIQKNGLYKLAQEDLQLAQDHLRQTNTLFNIGKIPKLDVMDAEQQLKAAEAKLTSADLNYQAALLKLNILLRKDYQKELVLNETSLGWGTPDQINIEATIENTLKNAPDIKLAALKAVNAKIQLFEDSTYFAQGLKLGASLYNLDNGDQIPIYSISLSGSLDDTYFRERNSSKKELDAAQLDLEVAVRNRQTLILESLRGWKILELSLGPVKESLNIAKERLRIATVKYDAGMASGTELNQVRQLLAQAEEGYWGTWLQLQQAREQFYQAVWGNPVLKQE